MTRASMAVNKQTSRPLQNEYPKTFHINTFPVVKGQHARHEMPTSLDVPSIEHLFQDVLGQLRALATSSGAADDDHSVLLQTVQDLLPL